MTLLKSLPSGYRFTQKEIQNQGTLVQIEMEKSLFECKYLDQNIKKIYIDITLDLNYPFTPPRLKTRSSFSRPSIADGRDLLLNILDKSSWSINITIFEVVLMIPKFVCKYLDLHNESITGSVVLGEFYLGEKYDINDWMTMPNCGVFAGKDLNERAISRHGRNVYVVVSESVVLMLEPDDKKKNQCTLLAWATLPTLAIIERYLDSPNDILLKWRSQTNPKELWSQRFELERGTECVNLIIKHMKNMKVLVEKSVKHRHKLGENEVTTKAVKGIDITEILNNIEIYESLLEQSITLSTVQTLMSLYQTGIEYYSAMNDENFDLLLRKMQDMLHRGDIQAVLNSIEQKPKGEKEQMEEERPLIQIEREGIEDEHTTEEIQKDDNGGDLEKVKLEGDKDLLNIQESPESVEEIKTAILENESITNTNTNQHSNSST